MIAVVHLAVVLAQQTAEEVTRSNPWQLRVDSGVVTLIAGTLLPLLVGFVTKLGAPPGLKALLLLVLSTASGLLTQAAVNDGVAVISKQAFMLAAGTFIVGVVTHKGLWKPLEVPAKLAPNNGVG